ncbi:DJ-1 family protein [Campylobacter sp. MIT 99-7217]|uniref:DJ-1 family glyoxalase III n=1 Tax=Campylobacter sp. MIT 99-7217 TaxID=535091 RepID=UPI001158331F|nr:DJ-1 family glyoxalase III [Campylobacter sp. MIT 99-7217]TQR33012.1 DJ-1 family protein [Campylobacter sp. MIT 99-7217]
MSKKILAPLATGFEEIEFVSIVDILRRAGLEVIIATLNDDFLVKGAHNIIIKAEVKLSSINAQMLDGIALAGGYDGMMNLKKSKEILQLIKDLHADKKLVSALCASPIVLHEAGVLGGNFTCYPGCEQGLKGTRLEKAVVINENIITSAGPATASLFALELVRYLCGEDTYNKLHKELLIPLIKA